jgi:hypothetical protein
MKINGIEGMGNIEFQAELQKGGKFVTYQYVISLLVITFKRSSDVYFVKADESAAAKGLLFTLLSLVLGWWGIPWGPIYTIQALIVNLGGGKDVTAQMLAAMAQSAQQKNVQP